jgi:hypothetical protein
VGDLLRDGRDACDLVFTSFDGASALGMALIAMDLAGDLGVEGNEARSEVEHMIREANRRGEELVVSLMVTRTVLTRILTASNIDAATRVAVALWLERPLTMGHYRVVAIAGDEVRAATVDGVTDVEDAPISSSMLN